MERRTLIKTVGGIGAATTLGVPLLLSERGVAATATQNFGSASVTSDDGTVDHLAIFGDTRVEWRGFEQEARSFEIDIAVGGDRLDSPVHLQTSGPHNLTADSWGGSGERFSGPGTSGWIESDVGYENQRRAPDKYWIIVAPDGDPSRADHPASDYGLPSNAVPASTYEVDRDGASKSFTLTLRSTYRWFSGEDGGGDLVFEKTFAAHISLAVDNIQATAEVTAPEDQVDNEDGAVAG